jgi:hypothetical protein
MQKTDEAEIFNLYREKKIFESLATGKTDNFINTIDVGHQNAILNDIIQKSINFQCCITSLKNILTAKGITKLKTQYRQFKYRQKNDLKSVLLKKTTLDLLGKLNDCEESLDDFIVGPLLDYEARQKDIAKYNDELSAPINDRFYILCRELSFAELKVIHTLFDKVYLEGFIDGQTARKARTDNTMNQVAISYRDKNSVLNDLKE